MSKVLTPTIDGIRRLVERELEPGDQLPTEQELVAQFGVSRATVRDAVTRLQAAGLVEKRWGVGTFVALPKPPSGSGLFSIRDGIPGILVTTGGQVTMHEFRAHEEPPDPVAFPDFPTAPVVSMLRVLALDGVPAAAIDDRIVAEYDGRRIDAEPLRSPDVLVHDMLGAVGVVLQRLEVDLRAADLDAHGREVFGVTTPEPVIIGDGVGYDRLDRPIVNAAVVYRTQVMRLRVNVS